MDETVTKLIHEDADSLPPLRMAKAFAPGGMSGGGAVRLSGSSLSFGVSNFVLTAHSDISSPLKSI